MTFLSESYKIRLMQLAGLKLFNESIDFNQKDLTNAYDKSWQRIQGFNLDMIKQAILEGRAIGISYKSTDMPITKFRIILPVTLGNYKTKDGVPLKLSAFHLAGQSERAAQKTGKRSADPQNVWRLFDLDPKSFKSMWFTDNFFYEYPPGYKKRDKRFASIFNEYDITTAEIERDEREQRGEKSGEPIDLKNIKPSGQIPLDAPENQEKQQSLASVDSQNKQITPQKNTNLPPSTSAEETPLTEKEKKTLYLKKPWNKYLRDGFKFS